MKHDCGSIESYGLHEFVVEWKNDSSELCKFSRADVSCGCLQVASYPLVVPSGETGHFRFALNPIGRKGLQDVTAVFFDKSSGRTITVNVTAVVRSFWTEPGVIGFGTVRPGSDSAAWSRTT